MAESDRTRPIRPAEALRLARKYREQGRHREANPLYCHALAARADDLSLRSGVARTRLGLGERVELEVPSEVVGEDAQLLPGAVGGVGKGWHGVEGESALQLRDGLLVCPTAGHEVPEVRERVLEIARDGRVLVGPIVRVKQIQLEVLRGCDA